MKKMILVLLLAAITAGGAYAADASFGLGGTFSVNFNIFSFNSDNTNLIPKNQIDMYNQNIAGGGFFAFADMNYIMFSLGMGFFNAAPSNNEIKKTLDDLNTDYYLSCFQIETYGKYPISLGKFTFFPMAGLDAKIILAAYSITDGKRTEYKEPESQEEDNVSIFDLSSIWIKFGAGADFPLSKKLYLRSMFLYGFGTLNRSQRNFQDSINKTQESGFIINHGLDVKLAIGFIP